MNIMNIRKVSRILSQFFISQQNHPKQFFSFAAKFDSQLFLKKLRRRKIVFVAAPITVIAAGLYYYQSQKSKPPIIKGPFEHTLIAEKPDFPVSRKVIGSTENFNLQLTLFQYPTCPFCCKVRAFLDYYGLPYDVIEVDPVLRQQTSWTTYKKVPILLAKVKDGYQQLNDSTMIISALQTFLLNPKQSLTEILQYYPIIQANEEKGPTFEILNKYFLMYNDELPVNATSKAVLEEKKWREWADTVLVHTLSPNVYRTTSEALQAFNWFSEVGEWDRLFPSWERNIIVYVGAYAMWIISKRLKKRHGLKDDVRQSLYDSCITWMKAIKEKGTTFLGGNSPNLADLAVYGVLSSIEGCSAFNDLLQNTTIGKWYYPMKEAVNNHKGKIKI